MGRQVIEGTEASPIRLRPGDLPDDADFSYLSHVNLTGRWGARKSLRYVDVVDSTIDANLTRSDIAHMETWRTDCEGIGVTREQADICESGIPRGYILTRVRNYLANTVGLSPENIRKLVGFIDIWGLTDDTRRSWKKLLIRGMQATGMTSQQMRDLLAHAYNDLPKNRQYQLEEDDTFNPPTLKLWHLDKATPYVGILATDWPQSMKNTFRKRDRWQLARDAEQLVTSLHGIPTKAFCPQMFPILKLRVVNLDAIDGDPGLGH